MSIRQKIEEILKENANISLDGLRNQLSEINPGSLKAEFYKAKRKLLGPAPRNKPKSELKDKPKKKSDQLQVNEYLDINEGTSFGTLKSVFPDINPASLTNYKSLWKKGQKNKPKSEDKPVQKKKLGKPTAKQMVKPTVKPEKTMQPDKGMSVKEIQIDLTELVESLKKTIEAQEQTIDALKRTTELLTPEINEAELQGMTFSEVKRIAVTFLRSIKDLSAKSRK